MTLWNVKPTPLANGWEWKGRGWSVLVYNLNAAPFDPAWVWQLHIGLITISRSGHCYAGPCAAKDALVRAVRRLGLRVKGGGRR